MPKPVFLLMPEWQGSASSRAMLIADGAEFLREDLPPSVTFDVEVPLEAGDAMGTPVARLSSLMQARNAARRVLRERASEAPAVILGGDCATALPGLEHAVRRYGAENIAVLWFDAHPDLQHPSTSPSGAASGMTLRHALGDGSPDLASPHPVDARHVALVGAREIDPEEVAEIAARGIHQIPHDDDFSVLDDFDPGSGEDTPVVDPRVLAADVTAWLAASGATHVYVHVDLDALNGFDFVAVHSISLGGLSVAQLTGAIRAAVSTLPLAGATISEYAPAHAASAAEFQPTVLRVLGAVTSGGAA